MLVAFDDLGPGDQQEASAEQALHEAGTLHEAL